MRIAQIPPLHEAVPPRLYGGTERVVSYLTEELVNLGHDVTLFGTGDSKTSAKLQVVWPRALRLDPSVRDSVAPHMLMMEEVRRMAGEFHSDRSQEVIGDVLREISNGHAAGPESEPPE